jgi:hypothetical protein
VYIEGEKEFSRILPHKFPRPGADKTGEPIEKKNFL